MTKSKNNHKDDIESNIRHENEQQAQDLYERYRFTADAGQQPLRVDKFLSNFLEKHSSRNRIQNAAKAGNILVNRQPVKSNYKVKPGDVVTVLLPEPKEIIEVVPQNIPLHIVYEDDDVMVVNKPANMVVHPAYGNHDGTLLNALTYYLQDKQDAEPLLVHRIDKNTSGLLLVAKNELAQLKIARQFFEHSVKRLYFALVWGNFKEDEGTIEGAVGRHPKNRKVMHVFEEEDKGKHALTHYRVVERFGYVSLVECRLETGRTHQIRIHMKHHQHPLFGDEEYGGNQILKGTRFNKYKQFIDNCLQLMPHQALHAKTLGFIHPGSEKEMNFTSELPENFEQLLDKWRTYVKYSKQ